MSVRTRACLASIVATAIVTLIIVPGPAIAENAPGISATGIKIGNTAPYSGPASALSSLPKSMGAVFQMINDRGGINGRMIEFISLDDVYSPPKTVEQTRRLVESDEVAFIFGSVGTATGSAVQKYLNQKMVPQIFVSSGAEKWGDYKQFPWSIGFQPSYKVEGRIYGQHIRETSPTARLGVIFQNDDLGKDYLAGLKEGLGPELAGKLAERPYEVVAPTIDSEVVTLKVGGVEDLVVVGLPRANAQIIRKVYELGWKPQLYVSSVGSQVGSVMKPAGGENAIGALTALYYKDASDPAWDNDPGMKEWRGFMAKYLPSADLADIASMAGYSQAMVMVQVLRQCESDLSRDNVMKQVANLRDIELPTLLPGIKVSTSPTDFHPLKQMRLARWDGTSWKPFGPIMGGKD